MRVRKSLRQQYCTNNHAVISITLLDLEQDARPESSACAPANVDSVG
jgi:hypothetical protein